MHEDEGRPCPRILKGLHQLEGCTPKMASQIISALQQTGRDIEPSKAAAKTSKSQRKKQKAEVALALHEPVRPLRPLNSCILPCKSSLPLERPPLYDEAALGSEHT